MDLEVCVLILKLTNKMQSRQVFFLMFDLEVHSSGIAEAWLGEF